MIKDKTVFILGAGASAPYGYPTMEQLREDIINHFDEYYSRWLFPPNTEDFIREEKLSQVRKFIDTYSKSGLIIDEFLSLDDNRDLLDWGKLAIVCSMVKFENESKFREESQDRDSDWYTTLWRMLYRNLPSDEKHNIFGYALSVITFNYDRSFEHFLFDSMWNTFRKQRKELTISLNNMKIHHVYGKLINLPWQDTNAYNAYGTIDNEFQINRCANNIDVMFESRFENPRIIRAQEAITHAKRIFFLGFGFDDFNLKILGIPQNIKPTHNVYGTTFGLDNQKKTQIEELFINNKKVTSIREFEDTNCNSFIKQHLFE